MSKLTNQRIILGVSGGIAAYKCADLVRRLRDAGAEVRVVMTQGATAFVTPLTLQAVSGHPVHMQLLEPESEQGMGHIELARWADRVLIAPATAHVMAKLAHGLADDLLSTLCLATQAPVLLAPAMNSQMWLHPATQSNRQLLEQRGIRFVGPGEGDLACGETGPGRMVDVEELVDALALQSHEGVLSGRKVVVTAGPTREPIDPVRFITNRSSGKMGYAVAAAAAAQGAEVTLVSGPVSLASPIGVKCIQVETAVEMHQQVMAQMSGCDIFIATAAVADYAPQQVADQKMKKDAASLNLALTRTQDILADVVLSDEGIFTVGFAAETERLAEYAKNKLQSKGLNMIAANQVGEGLGFDSDDNQLHLFWPGGDQLLPHTSKHELAQQLIKVIASRYHA